MKSPKPRVVFIYGNDGEIALRADARRELAAAASSRMHGAVYTYRQEI